MSVYLVLFSSLLYLKCAIWLVFIVHVQQCFQKIIESRYKFAKSFYFYGKPQKKYEFAAFVQFVGVIPL